MRFAPRLTPCGATKKNGLQHFCCNPLILLAEWTGLEPATPGVTGRYSNQLNYHSAAVEAFRLAPQVPPDLQNLPDATFRAAPAFPCQSKLASPRGFEPL